MRAGGYSDHDPATGQIAMRKPGGPGACAVAQLGSFP